MGFTDLTGYGLVKKWNDSNPDCRVKVGARITNVNDVQDDAALLLEECRKREVLESALSRSTEAWQFCLRRSVLAGGRRGCCRRRAVPVLRAATVHCVIV